MAQHKEPHALTWNTGLVIDRTIRESEVDGLIILLFGASCCKHGLRTQTWLEYTGTLLVVSGVQLQFTIHTIHTIHIYCSVFRTYDENCH